MITDNLLFRPGTVNDIDQLQKLRIISFGQYQNEMTPGNWAVFSKNLQNEQKLVNLVEIARYFICQVEDEIIGMAFLVPHGNPTEIFISEWAQIRLVGVNPKYQGKGIAKSLTKMCIDFAKNNNEKIIALHTSEFMHAARHIYEQLNFTILKEISPLYGKRYWIYTLKLG